MPIARHPQAPNVITYLLPLAVVVAPPAIIGFVKLGEGTQQQEPDKAMLGLILLTIAAGVTILVWLLYRFAYKSWRLAYQRHLAELAAHAEYERRRQAWLVSQLPENSLAYSEDPYSQVLTLTEKSSGSFFVGVDDRERSWQAAPPSHGVLVLGPSLSGKTSGVIIPGLLSARGPAVVTSTTGAVMESTYRVRSRLGRIWFVGPSDSPDSGVLGLRWSPLLAASTWEGARRVADSMVAAAGQVSGDAGSHGPDRTKGFLAALLHAGSLHGEVNMDTVRGWITNESYSAPLAILYSIHKQNGRHSEGARLAFRGLNGVAKSPDSTREKVIATAELATDIYNSRAGMRLSSHPNFDIRRFVNSNDTLYFVIPSQYQQNYLPFVSTLLNEIRHHVYESQNNNAGMNPLLFVLDEAANTAPIPDLPNLLSETGSRGLQVIASFQDLGQARQKWGADHGLLSKCRTKVILPGIAETEDLNALSTIMGDWDRPYRTESTTHSYNSGSSGHSAGTSNSEQYSTQREQLLSPSEVSRIPAGHAILVRDTRWSLVEMLPHYRSSAWQKIAAEHAVLNPVGNPDTIQPPSLDGLESLDRLTAEYQQAPWQHQPGNG